MSYFTYILLCDEKIYYVGSASNLNKRISDHKNKLSSYTKKFSVIKLVYFEKHNSLKDARRREEQFKGWSRAKKKALIEGNKTVLRKLSKST